MSRGLVGDRGGEPTVASPLLKQAFSLVDGTNGTLVGSPGAIAAVAAVPLPDSVMLLGLGVAALFAFAKWPVRSRQGFAFA